MKKTTKPSKTPAPATKFAAPAPAPKSTPAPKIKKSEAPSAMAMVTKPKGASVIITAKIDIGFGNVLFIRGDGAGLTWAKGTPLECSSSDGWTLTIAGVEKPFAFKFLVNDSAWSTGEDYYAAPGDTVLVTPVF
jgi:hypothetical protein